MCSLTNCGADGMGRHCREKKRCRVMKQQGAPVLEPCDQCHNVNVECQALSSSSTCGHCTVEGICHSHNPSSSRASDVVSNGLVI